MRVKKPHEMLEPTTLTADSASQGASTHGAGLAIMAPLGLLQMRAARTVLSHPSSWSPLPTLVSRSSPSVTDTVLDANVFICHLIPQLPVLT